MKIKIQFTGEFSDEYRRAIRNHYGRGGLATRQEVITWVRLYGISADDDIMSELEKEEEERAEVVRVLKKERRYERPPKSAISQREK